jgi:hypothetical protein
MISYDFHPEARADLIKFTTIFAKTALRPPIA